MKEKLMQAWKKHKPICIGIFAVIVIIIYKSPKDAHFRGRLFLRKKEKGYSEKQIVRIIIAAAAASHKPHFDRRYTILKNDFYFVGALFSHRRQQQHSVCNILCGGMEFLFFIPAMCHPPAPAA